jgi:hypothetical protein
MDVRVGANQHTQDFEFLDLRFAIPVSRGEGARARSATFFRFRVPSALPYYGYR